MSIKTPDNSLGEALAAILIMVYNPLTYRGYTFAPALGYNYYLGSRFYIPQLCRFMNADIYADTTQGVIGTNMFAYCNNNPISFVDPEGTNSDVNSKNNEGANLGLLGYLVTLIAFAYWLSTGVYLEPVTISISYTKVSEKEEAITEIKNKVKNDGKSKYWNASIKITDSGEKYVKLGSRINYSYAVTRARNGKSVFTTYLVDAYKIAKNAGNGIPLFHSYDECVDGYYSHYHLHKHSNNTHVWYLF